MLDDYREFLCFGLATILTMGLKPIQLNGHILGLRCGNISYVNNIPYYLGLNAQVSVMCNRTGSNHVTNTFVVGSA